MLSIRAFDKGFMMQVAEVSEGYDIAPLLETYLADPAIRFVDLHNARQGRFAARVTRKGADVIATARATA